MIAVPRRVVLPGGSGARFGFVDGGTAAAAPEAPSTITIVIDS
jgi:hypothetical protein